MERLGSRLKISRWMAMQIVWSGLVTTCFLLPFFYVFLLIPICFLTAFFYVKNFKLNASLLAITQLVACIISGGDFVVVLFAVLTLSGVLGTIWGLKCKGYQIGAAVTALFMLSVTVFSLTIYCASVNKKPSDFLADYVEEKLGGDAVFLRTDSQIKWMAKVHYFVLKINDELYDDNEEVLTYEESQELLIEKLWDFGEKRAYYDFMAYAVTSGLIVYLAAFIFDRKTKLFGLRRRNEFQVLTEPILFKNMRFNFKFFKRVFIPMFVFMFLGYLAELNMLVVAVVNTVITIPCNFAGIALIYHTICRIKKSRYVAYLQLNAILVFVCIACMLFPLLSVIIGMIGLADSIINVRRLLDYALS